MTDIKDLKERIKKKTKELKLMTRKIAQGENQVRELKIRALRKDGEITALKELLPKPKK